MADRRPQTKTFGELLEELRDATVSLDGPIIIAVDAESLGNINPTQDETILSDGEIAPAPPDYRRQYSKQPFFLMVQRLDGVSRPGGSGVTVGRSRSCDVRVEHDSVSKHHATVIYDHTRGCFVTDESSLNGTFVNGMQVVAGGRAVVCSGDHLSFGDAHFVFMDPVTVRRMVR